MQYSALLLLAFLLSATSAAPTVDRDAESQLSKRFVNLMDAEEQAIALDRRPGRPVIFQAAPSSTSTTSTASSKPTQAAKIYRPTYPSGISDPVPADSWLINTFAPTVAGYWNYTEEAWGPCRTNPASYDEPDEESSKCEPTCADVHSHTRFNLYIDCELHEICSFATFVLPDSECPDRPNSFNRRCPLSQEEWDTKGTKNRMFVRINEFPIADLLAGKSPTIEECKELAKKAPPTRRVYKVNTKKYKPKTKIFTRALSVRDPNRAVVLHKRLYNYRHQLSSMHLYRNAILSGTPDFDCDRWHEMPAGPSEMCPYTCNAISRTVYMEYVSLNGKRFALCTYPASTIDFADERCPGSPSPETECPQTEEEMVALFVKDGAGTEEKVRELMKLEQEKNEKSEKCQPDWEGAFPGMECRDIDFGF
ncbi:hypothetical protein BJ508DRAFT_419743 [Ascobolus immersus RN42]|uniref:Uncharacterized protein n=1 Tax=Ascobolus immersus RN42 TaxID=1160509 RepID=A0A3N4HE29_ASCIM|nr:hypothetical protein BJ508DRAFT_419743 [Ascobolus immersus RN42]